jgi:hypothetical protein
MSDFGMERRKRRDATKIARELAGAINPDAEVAKQDADASLPPLPPAPDRSGPMQVPAKASKALKALGGPPSDALAAADWAYRVQITLMHDCIKDDTLTARERRRELRALGAAAATLFPKHEEFLIREEIRRDRAEIELRAKQKGGARLEPAPPARVSAPAVVEDFGDGAS